MYVQDFDLAKSLANNEKFCGREVNHFTRNAQGVGRNVGIINTQGEDWKRIRRFSLATLRGEIL